MPSNPLQPTLAGYTILVADDEADSLMVAQILLEMAGATVKTASNGQDAIRCLEHFTPSFIITDLSMPVMNGWELLAQLRASKQWKDIFCLAFTAHAMQSDRENVYAAGFNGYLTKPLDPATFTENVAAQIRGLPAADPLLAGHEVKGRAADDRDPNAAGD